MISSFRTAAGPMFRGLRHQWRVTVSREAPRLSDFPPLVAELLHRRGIRTASEAAEFFTPSLSSLEDPALLPDIGPAAERLHGAKRRGERVAVYGDFDADGVTGTALLVKALRRLGLDTVAYIPHRIAEGHGLNDGAVQQLHEQGARLIVTVDCGVTDLGAVARAKSLGMDTIITDHHLTGALLPQAVAVINPHAEHSAYPFEHLTGAGMALKLAQALLAPIHGPAWADGLMELAAVGTITDMAPLFGENRYIVACGIEHMRRTKSVGLRALMRAGRIDPETVDAVGVGFGIGPRLNAAGRMDHAGTAYELLVTDDPGRAEQLTAELDEQNRLRQRLTEETLLEARALMPAEASLLTVAGSASFKPGVVGLVAGKLVEEFGVPAVVYSIEEGRVLASCRSGPSFHWADALKACEDLLLRHGGHAQAAGFACEQAAFSELQQRLEAIAAERMSGGPVLAERSIDAAVEIRELMGPTLQFLRRMEPFGMGNPAPLFLTRNLQVERATPMGAEGRHVRLSIKANGALWDAVAFRQPWLSGTQRVDLVYSVAVDRWKGTERLRLNIEDYAPSA